jgi:hypothetical protein
LTAGTAQQHVGAQFANGDMAERWLRGSIVVTDAETRSALADIYRRASADYLAGPPRTGSDPQSLRVRDSARYLRDVLHEVPVHVVPCIKGRVDCMSNGAAAGFYAYVRDRLSGFEPRESVAGRPRARSASHSPSALGLVSSSWPFSRSTLFTNRCTRRSGAGAVFSGADSPGGITSKR